ncbi:alcohol dehydrogenase, partial [candidate division TA06 bacterium]
MKAAVFRGPKQPLKIEDVDKPEPKPNEIVVKVAACGVCMTDLHYIDHGVPTFKKPPMILGHEPSGIVDKAGDEVKTFKPGDRVIIPPVFSCGYCKNCREGRENICENMQMMGNNFDGAYAEYVAVNSKDCISLPEDLPLEESAVIADALSTPYHAVKNRGRV